MSDVTIQEANAALIRLLNPPPLWDPYPLYTTMRDHAPVFQSALGVYVLTGFEEVSAVLKMPGMGNGPRFATQMRDDWEDHIALRLYLGALVTMDPPDHTRLRGLAGRVFTPGSIRGIRPTIERLMARHLDDMVERASGGGPVDLMETLAHPFPVAVISEMLGVPDEDGQMFYEVASDWSRVWGGNYSDAELDDANAAAKTLHDYFQELLKERLKNPKDDLISALAREGAADKTSEDELVGLAAFLFVAGFETTTELIGNGVFGLLNHPDQLEKWRRDPGVTGTAIEEMLRHSTPIPMASRVTKDEVEIGGETIGPGRMLLMIVAAANRDPRHFSDPDRLDLTRAEGPHLSFSGGAHFCLGANLARMETKVVFPAILERFSRIELHGRPVRREVIGLNGFRELPLLLGN